ncbi:hypothetical protein BWQ96_09295 [Gracilariopsis chorda]|uniref:Uncharacterized protein n=1 Tax=Gracilariopsis chorda TaxID=448386 RepID=A0A2V3IIQ1_9FLOR|nr:hypothetical protein BWQ96_09295 [Gracilariopsis chorda]|eukprot:PXF41000.1 hypothetical protein BWQ96_09295 [Gracilariopsis chorda]
MVDLEALSNLVWFVISTYVSAFLTWTVLTNTDFMSSKWVSVRRTRKAGYRFLLWKFVPMLYVIFYGVVQWKAGEFKEMAAAVIAMVFTALIGLRTVWGLWKLREFRWWAVKSIDALEAVQIEYSLLWLHKMREVHDFWLLDLSSEEIVDEILVYGKIVENQILRGDLQCFLKFEEREVLKMDENEFVRGMFDKGWRRDVKEAVEAMTQPFGMGRRRIVFVALVVLECVRSVIGKWSVRKVRHVPKEPIKVWFHWPSTCAVQVLQNRISEFQVASDLKGGKNKWKTAKEKFEARGKYFGS